MEKRETDLRRVGVWIAVVVAAATAAASGWALFELAHTVANFPKVLSPTLPIAIDGAGCVGALNWVAQRSGSTAHRWGRAVAVGALLISMAANGLHAYLGIPAGGILAYLAAAVAALIPASLWVTIHLISVQFSRDAQKPEAKPKSATAAKPQAQPAKQSPAKPAESKPERKPEPTAKADHTPAVSSQHETNGEVTMPDVINFQEHRDRGVCPKCDRPAKAWRRGVCENCYKKAKRDGTVDDLPVLSGAK